MFWQNYSDFMFSSLSVESVLSSKSSLKSQNVTLSKNESIQKVKCKALRVYTFFISIKNKEKKIFSKHQNVYNVTFIKQVSRKNTVEILVVNFYCRSLT